MPQSGVDESLADQLELIVVLQQRINSKLISSHIGHRLQAEEGERGERERGGEGGRERRIADLQDNHGHMPYILPLNSPTTVELLHVPLSFQPLTLG